MLLESEEGREGNIDWLPPICAQTRVETCNLVCALTRNRTLNPLAMGQCSNQWSHACQGSNWIFKMQTFEMLARKIELILVICSSNCIFYKVTTDAELVNTKPITASRGSPCEPLVTTFSSTNLYITLFYVEFLFKGT